MKDYDYIAINELKPYENNARTHSDEQIDLIVNSINEFGFVAPVIIDENNVILVGHGRTEAAKRAGLTEVPYRRITHLTDEQKRAYILADNKLSDLGGWDLDLLDLELSNIELDMEQFGFDIEIDEIEDEAEIFEDDIPEVKTETTVKFGDIYQLGKHRLMCGDSTDKETIIKLIDNTKVALALTDPPYGISVVNVKGNAGGAKPATFKGNIGGSVICEVNNYMPVKGDDTTKTAEENYKITKDLTENQIIFGGNYFTDFLPPSRCWVVWDKVNGDNYFADAELAWASFDKGVKLYSWLWAGMARQGDRATEGKKRVHPTQKPVGLLANILKDFTNEGDVILDCFGGSGSTLLACEKTGRKCLMIEYEPYYIDVIIQRWENLTGRKAEKING